LQAGARAGILAVGCCAPQICLDIYQAVEADDIERATSLQEKLTPLARAVTKTHGIGGLKAALEMGGYVGGAVRAPLRRPSEEACAEIADLVREATAVSVPGALATGS
jgi:dihydrodipicolinate synthase/N-acetylneuraminate lyase